MLQMGGGQRDDLGMVSVLLHENMCCDPSLEPSRRGGSNEGPQHIFCLEMGEIIFELSSIPLLIWGSGRAFMLFSFRHLNNNNKNTLLLWLSICIVGKEVNSI